MPRGRRRRAVDAIARFPHRGRPFAVVVPSASSRGVVEDDATRLAARVVVGDAHGDATGDDEHEQNDAGTRENTDDDDDEDDDDDDDDEREKRARRHRVHAIADERRTKTRDAARARRRADERGVWEERHRERGRGDVKRRTRSFQALAHEHDDAKEGDFYAARPGGEKGANVRVRRHGVRLFTHRSRARVRRVRRIISTIDAFRVRRDVLPKFHRH